MRTNTAGGSVDYTSPLLNLSFNVGSSPYFVRDERNFVLYQTVKHLPAMQGLSLADVFLDRGHSIEPHWHPNANELLYMVNGEIVEYIFNPFTSQLLHYRLGPQQSVYIPMGWWHWTIAITDRTRFVATFDNKEFEVTYGSDILRKTPPEVFQMVYGIDAAQWANVIRPINQTVVIGPLDTRARR
ncbi:Cupin [Evansella caseinilytica]|uniref:Cupin n=1 Tax=Evansella caseinilytica TaxID=1503961 RepID=A0A1H3U6G4_9BACI|nr:cupin domain-containing protein [Evansella caseinilytica]SDZ57415.1 Cupin [Evansella caseinilytica]